LELSQILLIAFEIIYIGLYIAIWAEKKWHNIE